MNSTEIPSPKRAVQLVAVVFLVEILALFIRSSLQIELASSGFSHHTAANLSYLVVPPVLLVLLYPITRDLLVTNCRKSKRSRPTLHIIAIAIVVGLCWRTFSWGMLISGVSFGLIAAAGTDASAITSIVFDCPPVHTLILTIAVSGIVVPLVEEVVNRGCLLQSILRFGTFRALIVSSAMFAVIHDGNSMHLAFLFGVIAGIFYINSGTLWAPIVAHATNNSLIVLDWDCLNVVWNPPESDRPVVAIGVAGVFCASVAIAAVCYLISKRVIDPSADDPSTRR